MLHEAEREDRGEDEAMFGNRTSRGDGSPEFHRRSRAGGSPLGMAVNVSLLREEEAHLDSVRVEELAPVP